METYLSFGVCVNPWTQEKDSRELRSTFLKRKRDKSEVRIQILHGPVGNERFLDVLFVWESQGRGEVELGDCMSKSWSMGFVIMHGSLALHVLNFNWLHVSGISTIISHASCIVKTPTTIYIYIYISHNLTT